MKFETLIVFQLTIKIHKIKNFIYTQANTRFTINALTINLNNFKNQTCRINRRINFHSNRKKTKKIYLLK